MTTVKLDLLKEVWGAIFPHRRLSIEEDKIEAVDPNGLRYKALLLSDGERVALYLIGQVLCVPDNAVVIVDEPEIHLHRAVQSPLWDMIERARPDVAFVYITHDLEFASTRRDARKVWIKSFDGKKWEWDEIQPQPGLPDDLLFQVIGSRKPVLFVEGDSSSLDLDTYSALFPNDLVVPRNGSSKVIEATKAMNGVETLHHMAPRGLVDRDRRSDVEVAALKDAGLIVADVAEVENLYCLPGVIEAVAAVLHEPNPAAATAAAVERAFAELVREKSRQAMARGLAEIQFKLNGFGPRVNTMNAEQLADELQRHLASINVESIVAGHLATFDNIVERRDYLRLLKYFNSKAILAIVAASLKVDKEVYTRIALKLVKDSPAGPVATAMKRAIEGVPG